MIRLEGKGGRDGRELRQLLVKALFEEAKKREVAAIKVTNQKKPAEPPSQTLSRERPSGCRL